MSAHFTLVDADDFGVRERVVAAAIGLYRSRAFHEVRTPTIAAAAGVSETALRALFPSDDALLLATIEQWNRQRMQPLRAVGTAHGAVALLRGTVIANLHDPGLMRLMVSTVNIAATPDHPLAAQLQENWLHFHASIQRQLTTDIREGREPETMNPARGAEQLIALYEGLQLQSMLRPHMNLVEAFDRAVTRLRDGWSHSYRPPVWQL